MIYDVDYFIQKFEAIPEHSIITCNIGSRWGKCANGHCGVGVDYKGTNESAALEALLSQLSLHWTMNSKSLSAGMPIKCRPARYSYTAEVINDALTQEYGQPTPKQRILASLRDVKKLQEKQEPVRERITYVVIPESVSKEMKKQVEETILS